MNHIDRYMQYDFLRDAFRLGGWSVMFFLGMSESGPENLEVSLTPDDCLLLIRGGTCVVRQGDFVVTLRADPRDVADAKRMQV